MIIPVFITGEFFLRIFPHLSARLVGGPRVHVSPVDLGLFPFLMELPIKFSEFNGGPSFGAVLVAADC